MKKVLAAVLGLAAGAVVASCSCGPNETYKTISAGSFHPPALSTAEADYSLVVADDKKTLTESFTRDGRKYVVTYQVTSTRKSEYSP